MMKRLSPFAFLLIVLVASVLACSLPGRLDSELATATPAADFAVEGANPATTDPGDEGRLPGAGAEVASEFEVSPTPAEIPPATATVSAVEQEAENAAGDPGAGPAAIADAPSEQQVSFERLASGEPPERDDLELARLYGDWDGSLSSPVAVTEPLAVGAVRPFKILNHDDITFSSGQFELRTVSEHAYFWFSQPVDTERLSPAALEATGQAFDEIYERSVAIFGPENSPGIDGDPRIHIVNASPGQLCADPDACGLAGYFSGGDVVPLEVDPNSNAAEMFVMNGDYFGNDFYLNVLAHELRHMIEDNTDRGDEAWEGEGSAMLAEDLLGYHENAVNRANIFLSQPDQQLNSWTDGNTIPYYGQGYLLNRYIYDRLGPELYRQFAASPATGLGAIDQVAAANGLDLNGHDLWLDWMVAMALIGYEQVPDVYRFGVMGFDQPAVTAVDQFPANFDETVRQYAADFYRLAGDEEVTIAFAGSQAVPLLDTGPNSGEAMWLADRANNSHARLTRALDLTGVTEATLEYSVYHDIEEGYDFAYLFVSEDDGRSWQPLVAEFMQGAEQDPSDSALADRFYSGRSDGWRREQIDLSPYAGQEILIRFAYVTDMVLTFGGIGLDDIAVPEIGFFDDAETPAEGWTAEGFERVTGSIPQQWELQLITFPDGQPQVERLPLQPDGSLEETMNLADSDGRAILIVSAWAPMTLQPAAYALSFQAP